MYVNPKTRKLTQVVFINTVATILEDMVNLSQKGTGQWCTLVKWLTGRTIPTAMDNAHSNNFFSKGCFGDMKFCKGGCGYWDDFRNPGL